MAATVIDGNEFFHRERGNGPVALFIHGFPLDSSMWIEQLVALSDVRRCVAPDLRGFGRSDPSIRPALSMDEHADDLVDLLDALGIDLVDLVGLSMGGYVSLAFAERHPERLRSLALVDTKATADSDEAKAGRDRMAAKVVAQGREAIVADLMPVLVAGTASTWLEGRVRQMVTDTRVETMVAALEGMKQRPDRTGVLGEIDVPVTVIVGEQDVLMTPADTRAMAEAAGATVTVIPDAGHMSPIEQPGAVAEALREFWTA
ncbi:MAG: alpha/beta hydrolase [Actinomycetota bacterium]|nr:alpha/beta hydrolase [Actinomycetota bacterium]